MLRLPLTALVLGIGLLLAAVNAGSPPAEAGVASEPPAVEQKAACPADEEAVPIAENLLPAKQPTEVDGRYRSETGRGVEPSLVEMLRVRRTPLEITGASLRLIPRLPALETLAVPPSDDPARS